MSKFAYVFPGQGSQSIGMLASMAQSCDDLLTTFNKASMAVGFDVWSLIQNGPEDTLNQTEFTQVAMLVSDVAIAMVMKQRAPLRASVMAGHSLGEYAALVMSDALSLEDAATLVQKRGQIMQRNVPQGEGAMAAIVGLDDEVVAKLCLEVSTETKCVMPANYNAIGQVVVAGHRSAVDAVIELALTHDARLAKLIPVSVPCHCTLLNDAAVEFESVLETYTFKTPSCPVIANATLQIYQDPKMIKQLLAEQLYKPVRWVETIQKIKSMGVETVFEAGPGKVLSGLNKRIDRELQSMSINTAEDVATWSTMVM